MGRVNLCFRNNLLPATSLNLISNYGERNCVFSALNVTIKCNAVVRSTVTRTIIP